MEIPTLEQYISDEVFLALIISISLIDIFANTLALYPVIGPIAESISESALEGIQILLVVIFGGRKYV